MTETAEPATWLRGDWMQTYTGKRFYPLAPAPEDVCGEDIAHALSMICRYGGHVDRFYSVAEHCVLMSQAVPPEDALHALLHDATEAYVGDMVRPLKHQEPMQPYVDAEERVWQAVCRHFDLDPVLPPSVKEADNRILITERNELMRHSGVTHTWHQDGLDPLPVSVNGWYPPAAEVLYLQRLHALLSLHRQVQTLTRVLEAEGPDPYPSGFFRHLAERKVYYGEEVP